MAKYLLIESRDPFETNEVVRDYELATNLAESGNSVTLFLVQNGVLSSRRGATSALGDVVASGVEVLSDDFSLRERGITDLVEGVKSAPLDTVVDQLVDGRKAMWL